MRKVDQRGDAARLGAVAPVLELLQELLLGSAGAVPQGRELVAIWERSTASKEQLLRQLQDWCHRAEASGVAPLVDFSHRLRSYAAA